VKPLLAMSSYQINQELLCYFIDYLAETKSQATIINITRDINLFLDYLKDQDDADIHSKYVNRYIKVLEEKYMESSFVAKLSSLRQFINWLNLENNPFWKLRVSFNHDDFDYYQEQELFQDFSSDFVYDELVIALIYELYLAQDEFIELNLEHYNQASNTVRIRGRDLVLSDSLAAKMRCYFKDYRIELARKQGSLTLTDPLFLRSLEADDASRMTGADLQQLLSNRGLGLVHLKRSRIIHLLDKAMSIEEIEKLLATKLSAFYRPFVKDKNYRLAKAYQEFHPRSRQ
jgi:site-specific recombinase XerD